MQTAALAPAAGDMIRQSSNVIEDSTVCNSASEDECFGFPAWDKDRMAEYEDGGDGYTLCGVRGWGPPLHCVMNGKRKVFSDGFGLCSPGRWAPHLRQDHHENPALDFHARLANKLLKHLADSLDVRKVAFLLATSKLDSSPFCEQLIDSGRRIMFDELKHAGCTLPVDERAEGQPFFLAALEGILQIAGDPDFAAYSIGVNSFAHGVRLGVDCELPRVSALFTAKKHWRSYDHVHEEAGMRETYVSALEHKEIVQKQFEQEAALGAMIEMDMQQACSSLVNIAVASLGALEKKDGSFRVIHDATNGLAVNSKIRVQDQIRSPTAIDVRRAMQTLPGACFVLKADVVRAHRLVKIDRRDWKHLACRTGVKEGHVWLNKVGTFGVASAVFHWCRLMSGIGRAEFYLTQKRALMHLVYVDDLIWIAGEKGGLEQIMLLVFFYTLLGVPFAWRKFAGGVQCSWVGFELDLGERVLGLTASRATWLVGWMQRAISAGEVNIADMRSVLGRLAFACSALTNFKPFLGPLYAWTAAMDSYNKRRLPKLVILILRFLSNALEKGQRLQGVGVFHEHVREVFRTDARAEGAEVWIGGWALDSEDASQCRWFAEKLNHHNAKWVFTAGESYRAIASLEMLATLVAVHLFGTPPGERSGTVCSAGTDNKSNSHIITRGLTTKYPLCIFTMELAMQLQTLGSELHLYWLPRLQNVEADRLTNGDFSGFSADKRLRFRLDDFCGHMMREMLEVGEELFKCIRKPNKIAETRPAKAQRLEGLRKREPW